MSNRPIPSALAATALAAALALAGSVLPAAADELDPWARIAAARHALESSSPLLADFEQSFVPAGFTGGDSERGRLAIGLPRCLRWDYDEPFARTYLLCGATAWSWNPGETSGRRQRLEADEARGLELLRLGVEELKARYRATAGAATAATVEVLLEPLAAGGEVRGASLVFDRAEHRPVALGYRDAEGNLTRFELASYRALPDAELFEPPAELVWLED